MNIYKNCTFTSDFFTGREFENVSFFDCDFSGLNLRDTHFVNCIFFFSEGDSGCNFTGAILKNASFLKCDLTMCIFISADLFGIEIRECCVIGTDFRNAKFMKAISHRFFFCSAYLIKNNFTRANFTGVTLEKCELWENCWNGTLVMGANFSGSDLSGGDFTNFNWRSGDITNCDLRGAILGDLEVRRTNLEGTQMDIEQITELMVALGITIS